MTKSDRVHEKVDRNAAVIARRAEGLTLAAIGLEFDISRGRVRQIIRRAVECRIERLSEASEQYLAGIRADIQGEIDENQ